MKRWIARAAALYPRSWREEYGAEFGALLDDVKPRWRVFADVLGGAIRMQMTMGNNWLKLSAATAVCGAIMAGGLSFTVTPQYVSSAAISVTPQPDPLRPESSRALRQRAAQHVAEMEAEILSRTSLSNIIQMPSLNLYPAEVKRLLIEDVIEKMRRNIRIQARSSTDGGPIVFSVSFSYPDQMKAEAALRVLAAKFTDANVNDNRNRATVYRDFWQDESISNHAKPAPPPPVGDTVSVLDPPSPPKQSEGPNRMLFLAWGLGAGLLVGLLAALAMRRPRGVWHLGGFAVAGCVLAWTASFLIPDRYTSTAIMMLSPAVITEDPLATPPAVTPAAEILRQLEPQVLSLQNLSQIIEDPRLNLYPAERARKPIEDVVRNMLARDLRIAPLNTASAAKDEVAALSISFSYYDRLKAQAFVQRLVTAFFDERRVEARAINSKASVAVRDIYQRKGGEMLDVLDPPSLPTSPERPSRMVIAAAGLGAGLLIGGIVLFMRRPRTPALQPA